MIEITKGIDAERIRKLVDKAAEKYPRFRERLKSDLVFLSQNPNTHLDSRYSLEVLLELVFRHENESVSLRIPLLEIKF